MQQQALGATDSVLSPSYPEMLVNVSLAIALGVVVSAVYKHTHKGLSYSQSFTHTLLFVSVIVAIVMMVIEGSLARAFALVGAMSIVRFRTVLKDTRDTAFVFAALALGMAAGTSNYFLAVLGTAAVSALALAMYKLNYGALHKSEFILRFVCSQQLGSTAHLEKIQEFSKRCNLLHMEPSADGEVLSLTYDIALKGGASAEELTRAMGKLEGVSEVVLIASTNDIDY